MPEKSLGLWASLVEWAQPIAQAGLLASVGVAIGIGQLLASSEILTWRIIVGRALSTGGLGMAAGMVLVWVPELPLLGQMGIAAGAASLGTSGLERMFQRLVQGRS